MGRGGEGGAVRGRWATGGEARRRGRGGPQEQTGGAPRPPARPEATTPCRCAGPSPGQPLAFPRSLLDPRSGRQRPRGAGAEPQDCAPGSGRPEVGVQAGEGRGWSVLECEEGVAEEGVAEEGLEIWESSEAPRAFKGLFVVFVERSVCWERARVEGLWPCGFEFLGLWEGQAFGCFVQCLSFIYALKTKRRTPLLPVYTQSWAVCPFQEKQ